MDQQYKDFFFLPLNLKRCYLKSPAGIKTYLTDHFLIEDKKKNSF